MPLAKKQKHPANRKKQSKRPAARKQPNKKASANSKVKKKSGKSGSILSQFFSPSKKSAAVITSAQTLAYKNIYPDGICKIDNHHYSKTVQFYDINYQLAQNEDKSAIFENYCDFLNYFDHSVSVQFTFVNQYTSMEEFNAVIEIPYQKDAFNKIRDEYDQMLKDQLTKGNNGLKKNKYVTFMIEADNLKMAKQRLERIENDVLNNFKAMGVRAESLNGHDRLRLLFDIMKNNKREKFNFDWSMLRSSGLSTKDFVAPSSFNFNKANSFMIGSHCASVSYLQILAPELTDRMLTDFLDLSNNLVVNIHIRSIDQSIAIKNIKRKLTDIEKMKIEEQKKAIRSGYDMDIIPADINTYGTEAKNLLEDLQSRNERMFMITFLVMNIAKDEKELADNVFQAQGVAQKYNCQLIHLDYQQEDALMSSLPLGMNKIPIERGLTTSSTAIFVPFTTYELFQTDGEALYYGLNALSNNMIMADRKKLKNPNGLILGTPGSGKSFSAKREITNVFLITKDDITILDPEAEYSPLVEQLNGQIVKVSPTSDQYINPMDINMNYADTDDPISLKSDFIISLCELIVGGRDGLLPTEITIIDRCVRTLYKNYFANNPTEENMPILQDLYELLREQDDVEAERIATSLEIYVTGSLNVFNHRTNVDINNRLVCFDIKDLGKQLKKIGMLIVQDQVWNRVTQNRNEGRATRYYIDEFHLLLREEQTAAYSVEIWKRFRKWGGIPTGITQNVKDLLSSREVENIFENSDFIYMLNQAAGDRQILAKALSISPHQLSYVKQSNAGEGLLFYGNVIIPFVDRFPKNLKLYEYMTTKPEEMNHDKKE